LHGTLFAKHHKIYEQVEMDVKQMHSHVCLLDVSTGMKLWFDVTVLLLGSSDRALTNDQLKQPQL